MSLRKRVSRGGVVLGFALNLFWATPLQSPALDLISYPLGKTASARGSDSAFQRRRSGEIPWLWSEHRPAEGDILERLAELQRCYVRTPAAGPPTSGRLGRYCDQQNYKTEVNPRALDLSV